MNDPNSYKTSKNSSSACFLVVRFPISRLSAGSFRLKSILICLLTPTLLLSFLKILFKRLKHSSVISWSSGSSTKMPSKINRGPNYFMALIVSPGDVLKRRFLIVLICWITWARCGWFRIYRLTCLWACWSGPLTGPFWRLRFRFRLILLLRAWCLLTPKIWGFWT
jgi:hypothetical protein